MHITAIDFFIDRIATPVLSTVTAYLVITTKKENLLRNKILILVLIMLCLYWFTLYFYIFGFFGGILVNTGFLLVCYFINRRNQDRRYD